MWMDNCTDSHRQTHQCIAAATHTGAKNDVLAVLAKLLAEPGKEIRAASLTTLEKAYEFQGEGG